MLISWGLICKVADIVGSFVVATLILTIWAKLTPQMEDFEHWDRVHHHDSGIVTRDQRKLKRLCIYTWFNYLYLEPRRLCMWFNLSASLLVHAVAWNDDGGFREAWHGGMHGAREKKMESHAHRMRLLPYLASPLSSSHCVVRNETLGLKKFFMRRRGIK
jgi:hypothetical protein